MDANKYMRSCDIVFVGQVEYAILSVNSRYRNISWWKIESNDSFLQPLEIDALVKS
jgi:hypothetical protein